MEWLKLERLKSDLRGIETLQVVTSRSTRIVLKSDLRGIETRQWADDLIKQQG